MSIKIMTRVWEHSEQGSSPLLLLLAIADNANDKGIAWPGQDTLAKKIRMSEKSVPRLAKKLMDSKELFVRNRSQTGKVTQYIVTVGMTLDQFEIALTSLKLSSVNFEKAKEWFAGGGQIGGGTIWGADIAMGRGVDIAMGTEPSLTVNEPSLSPNGGNGSTKTNKQPAKQIKPQLTDQQKNDLLVFGKHPDSDDVNPSFDTIQEIQNAGWEIRNHIVEQAIVYYLEAVREHHTAFAVPNDKSVRQDWYKAVNGHLQDYRIDDLKVMYPAAIERLKERGMTFTRPGSLTKSMPDVAMETQTGDVVAWL